MGFKCGIVGLPNVGKSTLFNALTCSEIEAQNYPFCTIEPNMGVVSVPDPRLEKISAIANSAKTIPALMEFVDIAGLVKGASQGEGLGNKFLSHIRSVDAIGHVVRCFEDDNVTHVDGKISPLDDIMTIETELALADIQTLEGAQIKVQKLCKSGDKQALKEKASIDKLLTHLNDDLFLPMDDLDEQDCLIVKKYQLLMAKPCFYIANCGEEFDENDQYWQAVLSHAKKRNSAVVRVCAAIEAEMMSMDAVEKQDFLNDLGLGESGLNAVIREGYALLGLITFFTAGPKEARAWTIKAGSTAPQAAGAIHSDFEKHFIRAEVVACQDYIDCGGEQGAKAKGVWRLEGKTYVVQDGDVLVIRANA